MLVWLKSNQYNELGKVDRSRVIGAGKCSSYLTPPFKCVKRLWCAASESVKSHEFEFHLINIPVCSPGNPLVILEHNRSPESTTVSSAST